MPGGYGGGGARGGFGYYGDDGSYGRDGGGGGGAGGGDGGAGYGAAGGAGGTASSPNGQAGAANSVRSGGGGGGGGGYDGNTSFGSMLVHNHSALRGGAGGAGGYGYDGGGGGGAGGYGAISRDANGATVTIRQSIVAGDGGAGGGALNVRGGDGGYGGIGLYVLSPGVTFKIYALIQGGAGGAAGSSRNGSAGSGGNAGAGIVGQDLTITNASTIQGGAGGGFNGLAGAGIGCGGTLSLTNSGKILAGTGPSSYAINCDTGTINNQSGGMIQGGAGGFNVPAGTGIQCGGTLSLTNSGMIVAGTGPQSYGVICGSGTINNQSGGVIRGGDVGIVGSNLTIVNNGTIAGAEAINFTGGMNSLTLGGTVSGEINVDGTLEFESTGTLSNVIDDYGTLAAATGTAVTFTGMVQRTTDTPTTVVFGMTGANGSFTFASGSTFSIFGAASFVSGTVTFDAGATISTTALDVDGATLAIAASRRYGGSFNLDSGALDLGANTLTLGRAANFNGGSVTGSGKLNVNGNSALGTSTIVGGAAKLVDGGTLTAKAALSLQSQADLALTANGTYYLVGSASISAQTSDDTITNRGFIYKSGDGTSLVTAAIANTGTIDAIVGTLDLTNNVSGAGTLQIAQSSTLELGGIIAAGQTATFGSSSGVLQLDNAGKFRATIDGFAQGDSINLTGFDGMAKVLYDATAHTLSVADGSQQFSAHLDGAYNANGFSLTHSKAGETIHYSRGA